MTANQILNSIPVLQKIMNYELPIKKAYQLYSFVKEINEKREFFINAEKKIIEKFNGSLLENGQIKFEDIAKQQEFLKEHDEMLQCKIDDIKPLKLSFNDLKMVELLPIELFNLDGVIDFID